MTKQYTDQQSIKYNLSFFSAVSFIAHVIEEVMIKKRAVYLREGLNLQFNTVYISD